MFEANFDGTNKGKGDGKGKFGAASGKSGDAPGQTKSKIKQGKVGQNENFGNCGIPGNNPNQGPEITLLGDNPQIILLNDAYVEAGAGVCDNIDDDTLNPIIDDTSVNTSIAGFYFVTYTATDSNGNITVKTRTVTVGNGGNNAPIFEVLVDPPGQGNDVTYTSDFVTNIDTNDNGQDRKYQEGVIQNIVDDGVNDGGDIVTTITNSNAPAFGTYTTTYTVTDDNTPSNVSVITESIIVCTGVVCPNNIPTADAGNDQTVTEGDTGITLDGTSSSDSDGTIASYAWSQTAGTTVTLSDDTASQPTFTAPTNGAGAETLTFSLIVTDNGSATSTADTVDITVNDAGVNLAPTVPNAIDDFSIDRAASNTVIDLNNVFDDDEGDAGLGYSIQSNTFSGVFSSISIDGSDNLIIDYQDDGAGEGTGTITIRATDSDASPLSKDEPFVVTVTGPSNFPPTITFSFGVTTPPILMTEYHQVDFFNTYQYKLNVLSDSGVTTGSGWYEQGVTIPIGVDAGGDGLILNTISEWEGADVIYDGNTAQIFVDGPVTVSAKVEKNYSLLIVVIVIPILVIGFVAAKKFKRSPIVEERPVEKIVERIIEKNRRGTSEKI